MEEKILRRSMNVIVDFIQTNFFILLSENKERRDENDIKVNIVVGHVLLLDIRVCNSGISE